MRMRTVEITVGAFMLAGILSLVFLAFAVSGYVVDDSARLYTVHARFNDVSGLTTRARVTVAGVNVGRVSAIRVDTQRAQAIVDLQLNANAGELSVDTGAKIVTEGVLGGKYIALVPGAEDDVLKDGSEIEDTQGALILEDLVGQFVKKMGE